MSEPATTVSADDVLSPYFGAHDVNKRIFRADLSAARYVLGLGDSGAPSALEFSAYHSEVTADLTGKRVELIELCSEDRLTEILERWATLYKATLENLRARHPAHDGAHLEFNGVDWTELLGISAAGLATIDQASRYAEFWAQQAVLRDDVYETYESRLEFVNSSTYREMSQLRERGEMLVFDRDRLGAPSYEIAEIARNRPAKISVRDWLMRNELYPTVLREPAECYLAAMSDKPASTREAHRVAVVTARVLRPFADCSLPWHSLAAYFARSRPEDPALAALDSRGAVGGCVISGNAPSVGPPPTRCLLVRDQSCAWALLDALRQVGPFQRLYFDRRLQQVVASVFPNQPIRGVWSYELDRPPATAHRDYSLRITDGAPNASFSESLTRGLHAALGVDVELVCGQSVLARCRLLGATSDLAIVITLAQRDGSDCAGELLARIGAAARHNGVLVQVLIEDRNEPCLRLVEAAGFSPSHHLLALDEWYFAEGARTLRRSEIPLEATSGSPAGSLKLLRLL